MSVMNDEWIRRMAKEEGMIAPFADEQVRNTSGGFVVGGERTAGQKVISYGTSSYGYDMRVAEEFKVFTPARCAVVDPKNLDERAFVDVTVDVKRDGFCLIPPNSFALARSVEAFKIPRYILAVVLGKSSYARCGLVVNVTPLEPEWRGFVTVEISNTTPLPARVYANEGIAQVLFLKSELPCTTSYADRKGKYQDQPADVILPRL